MQSWEGLGMTDVYYPNTAIPWRPEWSFSPAGANMGHSQGMPMEHGYGHSALPHISQSMPAEWHARSLPKPMLDERGSMSDSSTLSASSSMWPSPKDDPTESGRFSTRLTIVPPVVENDSDWHPPSYLSQSQMPYPPGAMYDHYNWQAQKHPLAKPRTSPRRNASEEEDRPWKCPVDGCGKTYRFKGDLKYHAQHKHMELPELPSQISRPRSDKIGKEYPCPWQSCASGFKWERDLKRHIKVKHNCDPEYAAYWARFENMAQPPEPNTTPTNGGNKFPQPQVKPENNGFERD